MKNLLLLISLLFIIPQMNAQSTVNYTLKVIDNKSNPVSEISVTLIETTSKKRIHSKTNSKGTVTFEINYGNEWAVNVAEI